MLAARPCRLRCLRDGIMFLVGGVEEDLDRAVGGRTG